MVTNLMSKLSGAIQPILELSQGVQPITHFYLQLLELMAKARVYIYAEIKFVLFFREIVVAVH